MPAKVLLEEAERCAIETLVLTDINTTAACLNFVRLAKKTKVRPVLGIDFRNGAEQQFIAIAQNNEGFKGLNDFLSHHLHEELSIPERAPQLPHTFIIYPFHQSNKKANFAPCSND